MDEAVVEEPIEPAEDWRTFLTFETPVRVSSVYPWMRGAVYKDVLWCSSCGGGSPVRSGDDLWAVKHHHAGQPLGHLRFYCLEHYPQREWESGSGSGGAATALCPTCFTELPRTGVCDTCG